MGFNGDGSASDLSRRSSSEFSVPNDESDPKMGEGSSLLGVDVFGERLQDIDVWNY
jgi:hypothetical protein